MSLPRVVRADLVRLLASTSRRKRWTARAVHCMASTLRRRGLLDAEEALDWAMRDPRDRAWRACQERYLRARGLLWGLVLLAVARAAAEPVVRLTIVDSVPKRRPLPEGREALERAIRHARPTCKASSLERRQARARRTELDSSPNAAASSTMREPSRRSALAGWLPESYRGMTAEQLRAELAALNDPRAEHSHLDARHILRGAP